MDDPRFARLQNDPRFQRMPAAKNRLKVDKRFGAMFTDPRFTSHSAVDKRGRKQKQVKQEADLRRLYEVDADEDGASPRGAVDKKGKQPKVDPSAKAPKVERERSPAVKDGKTKAGKLKAAVPTIPRGQETRRLALVEMDWSNVRAVDLYVLLSSFAPTPGGLLSVTVYPSDFGLEKMKEEEVRGPVDAWVDEEQPQKGEGGGAV
eukprot:jgi/Mesvir1/19883/Mv13168-RA.1